MINKIHFPGLLNEMKNFNPIKFKTEKAARVWMICVRHAHFKLAESIERKYAKPNHYDIVEALKYSLMAFAHEQSKNKNP